MPQLASNVYAVILAGGSGTRFWPKSRLKRPKQLCRIGDSDHTMIELTLQRLDGLVPVERRIIVTHQEQMEATQALTKNACKHFLAEPSAKNTANALALAVLEVKKLAEQDGAHEPIMISLHADALIAKLDRFQSTLHEMAQTAREGFLTLLGVTPEYPETGYGYIEKGEKFSGMPAAYRVSSFREKPNAVLAQDYIATRRFLWNSGIFCWQISTVLDELRHFVPASMSKLETLLGSSKSFTAIPRPRLTETYNQLESIAIDPAVLEKSSRVAVVEADIGWKDVGSWDALDQCFKPDAQGNLFYGETIAIDSTGITVDSDAKVVACIGVKDLVIVCSEGAILVCPKDKAQDVKKIVDELKKRGQSQLT